MAWVFLLVVPLSIMGMRYARHILAAWCFRTHAVSMGVFAGVPLVAAFVLGYMATTPDNFVETHTVSGHLSFFFLSFWSNKIIDP